MNRTISGVMGPGFLNQVPTLVRIMMFTAATRPGRKAQKGFGLRLDTADTRQQLIIQHV